ncbi:MAG TPA: MFS transporter, partial [Tetragenococcus sp.]|nr:MFS transporter [Tetragenococcus sp.]
QLNLLERADGNALLTTLQQFAGAVGTSSAAAFIAQSQASIDQPAAAITTGSQKVFIFLLILNLLQSLILFKVVKK